MDSMYNNPMRAVMVDRTYKSTEAISHSLKNKAEKPMCKQRNIPSSINSHHTSPH